MVYVGRQVLCGAQMFKEVKKKVLRASLSNAVMKKIGTSANRDYVSQCPFCNTMMTDGESEAGRESSDSVQGIFDVAELVVSSSIREPLGRV